MTTKTLTPEEQALYEAHKAEVSKRIQAAWDKAGKPKSKK